MTLLPRGAQCDLQQRQVARLVGDVALYRLRERLKSGFVKFARSAQRLADGVAQALFGNSFQAQNRIAAVGVESFERSLAVSARNRLSGAVLHAAQEIEIVGADSEDDAHVLVAVGDPEQ